MEIIVFENQDVYDMMKVDQENAVDMFIKMCRRYANPELIAEDFVDLQITHETIIYKESESSDKPNMVMMVNVKLEMIEKITYELSRFYIESCSGCSIDIPLHTGVCDVCETM